MCICVFLTALRCFILLPSRSSASPPLIIEALCGERSALKAMLQAWRRRWRSSSVSAGRWRTEGRMFPQTTDEIAPRRGDVGWDVRQASCRIRTPNEGRKASFLEPQNLHRCHRRAILACAKVRLQGSNVQRPIEPGSHHPGLVLVFPRSGFILRRSYST